MKTTVSIRLALVLLFAVISAPTSRPQERKEPDNSAKPSALSHKEQAKQEKRTDWSRGEAQDGGAWFGHGYELHSADRYPEAIEAFKHAIDLGYRKGTAMYNIACGYSLLNDKENALAWLQRALDNGFDSVDHIADDSDLDPLRTDQRFRTLFAKMVADNEPERPHHTDRLEQANLDFAHLEREGSKDGEEWSHVGLRLLLVRDLDRAMIALNRAVGYLDYKGSSAMYNLACANALGGSREAGLLWLEKSVNAGFDNPEKLRDDPDIASLRTDARFPAIQKLSNTLSLSQFQRDDNHSDNGYSKARWAPAIQLYESFVQTTPESGRGWFNLGYALHYSREHAKAISAFEHALSLGYNKPTSTYNIACGYAMLNQRDAAFEWLDRALAAGFDSFGTLNWDKDLESLRSDPRFKRFRDKADYNTKLRTRK